MTKTDKCYILLKRSRGAILKEKYLVELSMSWQELRASIRQELNLPVTMFKIKKRTILQDEQDKTLGGCGVVDGCTVEVVATAGLGSRY